MSGDIHPADAGLHLHQVLLGKYRVEQILGQGGMGIVARCTHLALDEQVAIKLLRPDIMIHGDVRERFMREGRAAARLKSEHVARVTDVGTFDNGIPYMVMEFLDGHDLGALIARRQAIPIAWGAELILQAAEALGEAHSLGIVHRDVKPTNLFVTWRPDGSAMIKVLDFGISKATNDTDLALTQTQSVLGTPAYMSPEQMRSAKLVDERSDIWSLGSVMYELFEGRRAFEAESFSEMCVKVAMDPPAPMTMAPPALQQIVLRCLAKAPDQRYQRMAELARELVPFVQNPQAGMAIVERMQRLAGRRNSSSTDWGGESTSAGMRTPLPVRDYGSAPLAVPAPWGSPGTDPSGMAFPSTPSSGVPQPASRERSAPVPLPAKAAKRRGAAPKVLLALVVAGVGIGIGIGLAGAGDDDAAKPPAVTPLVTPSGDRTERTEPAPEATPPEPVPEAVEARPEVTPEAGPPAPVADPPEIEIEIDEGVPPGDGASEPVRKKPPPKKPVIKPTPKPPDPPPVKKDPFASPR